MSATLGNATDILDYLRGERDGIVDLIRELVEAESPSDQPDLHPAPQRVIMRRLGALDFRATDVGKGAHTHHVYARPKNRRRGQAIQLLVGHYDTVWPAGTLAERPFSIDGNVISGPGSFDMKGGIAQIVFALEAIRHFALDLPLSPSIFINSDEEIGSRSSTRYIRRLAAASRRAFILEPALGEGGSLKTARKGVGRYTVTVHGRSAHAGLNPEEGSSAILELASVIQALFALNDPAAGISVNVGTVDGGLKPNVIAPFSSAVVDVRVPTHADGERIDAAIRGISPKTDGTRIVVEGGIGRPSMEFTERNKSLWLVARQLGESLGLDLQSARAGGGSDGNTTSQYTATLDGLGPVGDGAHAEHEHLLLDRTIERTALLALLLLAPDAASERGDEGQRDEKWARRS